MTDDTVLAPERLLAMRDRLIRERDQARTETARVQATRAAGAVLIEHAVACLARDHGDPARIVDVTARYGDRYDVTLLQWATHGVAVRRGHEVHLPDATPESARQFAAKRFGKLFSHQVGLAARFGGTATVVDPSEYDLTRVRIERPLAAILESAYGSDAGGPGSIVRRAMRAGETVHYASRQGTFADRDMDIEVARGVVRGAFETRVGKTTLGWSKGAIRIDRVVLPDAVLGSLAGRPLGDLIDHPFFDPDMLVTSAHVVEKSDRRVLHATLKGVEREMPEGW